MDAVELRMNPPRWWKPARIGLAAVLLIGVACGSSICLAAVLGWVLLGVLRGATP